MIPGKRKDFLDRENNQISLTRQLELLGISRSSHYYKTKKSSKKSLDDQVIMRVIDEIYTKHPFYGMRKIKNRLNSLHKINIGRKRIRRLMREMGIRTLFPEPKTTIANKEHKKYPYLLRNKEIQKNNEVWSTDITYIRMNNGWIYLTAIIDWHSRYILSWEISITLDTEFCIKALDSALQQNKKPEIFNSDQGCQYTSNRFTGILENNKIQISMDGKGRCLDNIFIERFWRSLKQEEVYLKAYESVADAYANIKAYINFYNHERPHQSLEYKTPAEVYFSKTKTAPLNS